MSGLESSSEQAAVSILCSLQFSIMTALKSGQFHAIVTTSKSLFQTGKAFLLIVQAAVNSSNNSGL
jgi:hypothetical protein